MRLQEGVGRPIRQWPLTSGGGGAISYDVKGEQWVLSREYSLGHFKSASKDSMTPPLTGWVTIDGKAPGPTLTLAKRPSMAPEASTVQLASKTAARTAHLDRQITGSSKRTPTGGFFAENRPESPPCALGRDRKIPAQDRLCTGNDKRTPTGGFFPQTGQEKFPRAPGSPGRSTEPYKMGQLVDPSEVRPVSFSSDGKFTGHGDSEGKALTTLPKHESVWAATLCAERSEHKPTPR